MKPGYGSVLLWLMAAASLLITSPLEASCGQTEGLNEWDVQMEGVKEGDVMMGKRIYSVNCILCHGSKGEGNGPAAIFIGPYSHPRPNDFTMGSFKFRSTETGELPTLSDIMRTIRYGIPGYMPSFRHLGGEGVRQVALYIATQFIQEDLPAETTVKYIEHEDFLTEGSIQRGKRLYNEMHCAACHEADGRGRVEQLEDDSGLGIRPADLTQPGSFGRGSRHEDIYKTIMTGLSGTPMPSFVDLFKGREEEVWDLVHYVLSLQEE